MKLRELIFSQPQWTNKILWDYIQAELGGKVIYVRKINAKETQHRDELIRGLFHNKNKSVHELSKEFGVCEMRIWQIVWVGKKQ